ncbi:hypothetical protein [Paenibacillus dakarensis]|uniref:hypothetical protein n=1 Tax=Paenibacillus dakarensis TaxID=1527293 RepID=UPI0006D54C7F|nr:hypothetical protein [Paenibacillus dakarensis]
MKKLIVILAAIVVISAGIFLIIDLYPKDVNIHAQGLKYRLGTSDKGEEKFVNVDIEGKVHKSITGKRTFTGQVNIEGEEIPVPEDQRTLKDVPMMDGNLIALMYPFFKYNSQNGAVISSGSYHYGMLAFSSDFSQATILLAEPPQDGQKEGSYESWNGDYGRMVTVPASNRDDAIRITNELLKETYRGYKFK